MDLFRGFVRAQFVSRPNRFVAECLLNDRTVRAYLPNPGRMWELLFPGVLLSLVALPPSPNRALRYVVVAVERDGMQMEPRWTPVNNATSRSGPDESGSRPRGHGAHA